MRLFGIRPTPRLIVDAVIRLAEGGDRFGLRRGGLTFDRLTADHPHGVVLAPQPARTACSRDAVVYRGRRMRLRHRQIADEDRRAGAPQRPPDGYPLRMIGMREPRSENSWMHNSPLLMRGERDQPR